MSFDAAARVHVAPLGLEHDRIVDPPVEYGADRVVLLDYLPDYLDDRLTPDDIVAEFDDRGIAAEVVECEMGDFFDAMAVFGAVITDHPDDEVYVNLATGNKVTAIAGMLACMATEAAQPYYVEAEDHGSHRAPVPTGVRSIDAIPRYPIDRPDDQLLEVMEFVATSDRADHDGEPYRIKRELIEFGEREDLPFLADYTGETEKGKFRRLEAHVVTPLTDRGYVDVESVGTRKRVYLTDLGHNVLRAFRFRTG
ncbi:hypothetical protein BRD00_02525 [Halobacteriales archaeon QS_8_69_26]|nr:MAG: hypothetical protein BRD00_02525 [Halobacteriales archaeon QS_8_69_26]